jgi:hypothetical protein
MICEARIIFVERICFVYATHIDWIYRNGPQSDLRVYYPLHAMTRHREEERLGRTLG